MRKKRSKSENGYVAVPTMQDRSFLSIIPFPKLTIEGGWSGLVSVALVFATALALALLLGQLHP